MHADSLSFTGHTAVPLNEVLSRVEAGEIIIVRKAVQSLGCWQPLLEKIRGALEAVIGPTRAASVFDAGFEQLHGLVTSSELTDWVAALQKELAPVGLEMVKRLASEHLGLAGEFYLEETFNSRAFVPEDAWPESRGDFLAFEKKFSRGKVTVHGLHNDTSYYHPVNVVNVWTAIGRVRNGNGMSFFPQLFGQYLPCLPDGCVQDDQTLGPGLNFSLDPGDALLFHIGHLHGSEINQTDETRFAISGRFTLGEPKLVDQPWHNYLPASETPACWGKKPAPHTTATAPPRRPEVTLDTSSRRPSAPPCRPGSGAGTWTFHASEVPLGTIRPWNDDFIVVRTEKGCSLLSRRCPHAGIDLAGGYLREGCVHCPGHNLKVDPCSGSSPCRTLPVAQSLPCQAMGDMFVATVPSANLEQPAPATTWWRSLRLLLKRSA